MRKPIYRKSLKQQMSENVSAMMGMAQTDEQRDRIAQDFPLPEIRARKPRMKPEGLSELQEQIRVIKWWDSVCHHYDLLPVHLFHIANGGSRGAIEAVNLKRSGVRPGIPDLFLSAPFDGFHGLYVEMKAHGGKIDPVQKQTIDSLRERGYKCAICFGHEEAIVAITRYVAR